MHFAAKPFRSTVEASASVSQLRKWIWHTSATSQNSSIIWQLRNHCEMEKRDFAPKVPFRRAFRNCESGFGTRVPLRSTVTSISQLRNSLRSCCENGKLLRNWRFPLHLLRQATPSVFRSSSPFSSAGQRSIAQNGTNERAKSSSLRTAKGVCERSQVQVLFQNLLQSLRRRDQTSSSEAGATKAAGKAIFNKVRRSAIEEETRVESSEPIDLTEQSPEKSPKLTPVQSPVSSPNPSPVKFQCRHRFPRQFPHQATPIPSPVPSPAPQEKAQEPQAPIPEPQIAAEAPLEEVIRRPMLPSPQSKETWIVELGHSILIGFDLAAFRVRPELAQSFQLLRRYHMEHLLAPRDFFYPRVVTDFYQTMTTKEVRNPTLIHFIIDGSMVFWEQDTLLKLCKFLLSQPNSTILKLGQIQLRKVHKKKLQRADCIPLLFPRLLCQVLEHLGYPSEPQQERKRICREPFTLDKWNNMTAYKIDQPGQPQQQQQGEPPQDIHLKDGHPYIRISRAVPCIGDSYSFPEQSCSGVGSHQSMPGADVSLSGSTSCHPKAASSPFRSATSCRASTETPPEPHSQPSESQAPEPEAPADPPTEEADPSA
ncbi:hypothetical protein CK203_063662 [Vitis vinifera]|uniref:Uncharacterized protein n=1 Tax=Vitis vinifera TaxID=29760 RepID=A0A438G411_VITVI|nr:hypothetical protein CK203_063662 [Vitis vinifera]